VSGKYHGVTLGSWRRVRIVTSRRRLLIILSGTCSRLLWNVLQGAMPIAPTDCASLWLNSAEADRRPPLDAPVATKSREGREYQRLAEGPAHFGPQHCGGAAVRCSMKTFHEVLAANSANRHRSPSRASKRRNQPGHQRNHSSCGRPVQPALAYLLGVVALDAIDR